MSESMGPSAGQIEALLTALTSQTRQVEKLRETTQEQSESIKWGRRMLAVALLAVVAALVFGYTAHDAATKAEAAIELSIEQRDVAQRTACLQDNAIAESRRSNLDHVADAAKAGDRAGFEVFRLFVTDPEDQTQLEEFLAAVAQTGGKAIDEAVDKAQKSIGFPDGDGGLVPLRDCSLEGIEKYLASNNGDS